MNALERSTKLLVLVWALLAVAAEVWLLRGWRLLTIAEVAFVLAAAIALVDRRIVAVVLAFAYVFPALLGIRLGAYQAQFSVVWMAALVGVLLPDGVRSGWHVPVRWRGALVCWALTVVAGVSIVVWREVDFNAAVLFEYGLSNSSGGGYPTSVVSWVLHVGLVLVLGILWFDWLFGAELDFEQIVAKPLFASGLVLAIVAVYQMAVDITFLNETVYASLGRAAGTMRDANVSGTIAAMWIGGATMLSWQGKRWQLCARAGGGGLAWLAVWASGSRTAFAAAAMVTVFGVVAVLRARRGAGSRRAVVVAAAAAATLVVAAVLLSSAATDVGPIRRLWETLPTTSVQAFVGELWRRDGYGTAATAMIRDSPWFGIGVGLYPRFLADVVPTLPGDNAQNWYRHQLAEFGVIGSLGWIAWLVGFGRLVFKGGTLQPSALIVRGVILAVAAVSLLGMPTQDVSVAITFWTFAYWCVTLAPAQEPAASLGWRSWAAVVTVVLVFAAGTGDLAMTRLRVPMRAQRVGWPYMYGFSFPEPDTSGGEYRWARQRAVAVVDAPRRWLALTIRVNHLDVVERPVDAKVWRDGRLLLAERLADAKPVTRYVRLPDAERRVVIETWVSRTVQPRNYGVGDARELGLMVKWDFVNGPPPTMDPALVQRP